MSLSDSLRSAIVIANVVAALLLAGAYVLMGRAYPRRYLRWWALAWVGEAAFAFSGLAALELRKLPDGLPWSLACTLIGQWGIHTAALLVPLGAWAIATGRDDLRMLARRAVYIALGVALLATFAVPLTDPAARDLRFAVRVVLPRIASMIGLLASVVLLRQVARRTGLSGYRWTWRMLAIAAVSRGQYLLLGAFGDRLLPREILPAYFGVLPLVDTLLLAAIGVTTAVALVEDEALAARQALEARAAAEQAAARSAAGLVSALDALSDQVIVLDGEGRLAAWNPPFADVLRRQGRPAPTVGAALVDVVAPERAADWRTRLPALLGGDAMAFEASIAYPEDDTPGYFDVTARPIRDGDPERGAVTGAVIVSRDVTARRALEARLQQTQRLDTVGRLAGGIAHDFNNLLTAILGSASMARETIPLEHEAQADLGDVLLAAERAAQLTRQLLAFARRHPVTQQSLDIGERLSVMERMLSRLVGPNIKLRAELGDALWAVRADPAQLEQVIVNLVVNARDAMPAGGALTLRTANRVIGPTTRTDRLPRPVPPGEYVEIVVEDTGIGMDPQTLAHAFEPFFTTKPVGQGTGLGLAMCYGIIRQQNGVIWIESEPGRGSAVHIVFPRHLGEVPVPADAVVLAPTPTPAQGGSETILLVEDEPQVRAVAARTLRGAGYRVLKATNGRDGLQLARRERGTIDLVLTDIVMPEMGGREMAELLRQFVPQAVVLYMSGFTAGGLPIPGTDAEARHFLQKPFTPPALLARVRLLLDERPPLAQPADLPAIA